MHCTWGEEAFPVFIVPCLLCLVSECWMAGKGQKQLCFYKVGDKGSWGGRGGRKVSEFLLEKGLKQTQDTCG